MEEVLEISEASFDSLRAWLDFNAGRVSNFWCCVVRLVELGVARAPPLRADKALLVAYRFALEEGQLLKEFEKVRGELGDFAQELLEADMIEDVKLPPLSLVCKRRMIVRKLNARYGIAN